MGQNKWVYVQSQTAHADWSSKDAIWLRAPKHFSNTTIMPIVTLIRKWPHTIDGV